MLRVLLCYVIIFAFIFIKNKYLYIKCTYLMNALLENKDNCKYILPVKSILHKADLITFEKTKPQNFIDNHHTKDICECLLVARGIFYTRYMRSPLWLYYAISSLSIFSFIKKATSNKLCTLFFAIIEWFFCTCLDCTLIQRALVTAF